MDSNTITIDESTAHTSREKLHIALNNLLEKYEKNEYITGRIYNHIEKLLPVILDNEEKTQVQRDERKKQLSTICDEFTERFMHKNCYFYSPYCELFLRYDGSHFDNYSEDNIQHQILTRITAEQNLIPWKHKITKKIMKTIKERSPLTHLPESDTIQFVINSIYPTIFSSRNHAKYFLTIIGDCINNKTSQNITYIASPNLKELIREIGNQCYTYFGVPNVFHAIKYKYYDHNYINCRLLYISNSHTKQFIVSSKISKYMLDLLCVACHYSTRYGSADGFLEQCNETSLINNALYLHKNTLTNIVDAFIKTAIQPCQTATMKSKNMIFVWKKYLEERNVPNIVFYENLKTVFREKLTYDESTDSYLNVTSVHLPLVSSFIQFWDVNINEDDSDTEIEIDELSKLFKNWLGKTNITNNATDSLLIELIRHLYPDIIIDDDKYILNINCILWDKRTEVINTLEVYKSVCKDKENESMQSLYSAYEFYSAHNTNSYVMSKRYFEKTAKDVLGDYVDGDGLILSNWWK